MFTLALRRRVLGFEVSARGSACNPGFSEYLDAELRRFRLAAQLMVRSQHLANGSNNGKRIFEDLPIIVTVLKHEHALTREQLRLKLKDRIQINGESYLDLSMDFAACLLTMLNIRDVRFKLQTPQTPSIQWEDGTTLETLVAGQFPVAPWSVSSRQGRLHPAFTIANMTRICGLRILWTHCLADHLRLDQGSRVLKVFPYKQSLLDHLEGLRKHAQPAIIPESVLAETIQSLDLLFPHWDFRTNVLLKEHNQSFHQIGPFPSSRHLNLCEFEHWRDRLAELYEEVYCCPPVSWTQLWADRRNPQQWYTFWIALLILFLTIISTLMAIVQAWASVKSLELAIEALRNT